MIMDYVFAGNLAQTRNIPIDGILSRTTCKHDHFTVITFGFDARQEFSGSVPAILYIVQSYAKTQLIMAKHTLEKIA